MAKHTLRWLPLALTLFLLVACELGQGVPSGDETPTVEVLIPAELPTATPGEGAPPTVTPSGEPGVAETLGPVTVTGEFTVGNTVTIRVQRGEAVSSVNCLYVHQESGDTVVLDPPTSSTTPSLDGTFEEVFTFTPAQGGTYSISCTGVALTIEGLREVEAQSSSFSIEAKG